ncbi:alpha/beta fold hydrolase [Nocardioides sp.]|uniref:alpha/beta fold hydrolase n=1 Tax=Nocardioides sp. TaxID=35761 RepID=UPI0039E30DE0
MTLNTLALGESGSRVVFLHGLFGQGRNWSTIGRALADRHRVTLVDLPNHGRSPWTEQVDYVDMAEQVAGLLSADDPVTLVGHSMGGKVAMVLALRHPELVTRLVVADISPVDYGEEHDASGSPGGVLRYARVLLDLDLTGVTRREQADELLRPAESDATIRSFLLQNLHRDARPDGPSGWRWAANLAAVVRDGRALSGWPAVAVAGRTYDGPVLWLAGERSGYVREEFAPAMRRLFPHYRKVVLKGAGHWLHSERPEVFLAVLRRFLGD